MHNSADAFARVSFHASVIMKGASSWNPSSVAVTRKKPLVPFRDVSLSLICSACSSAARTWSHPCVWSCAPAPLLPMARTDLAATHASGPPPGPHRHGFHDHIAALLSRMPLCKPRDCQSQSHGLSNPSQERGIVDGQTCIRIHRTMPKPARHNRDMHVLTSCANLQILSYEPYNF